MVKKETHTFLFLHLFSLFLQKCSLSISFFHSRNWTHFEEHQHKSLFTIFSNLLVFLFFLPKSPKNNSLMKLLRSISIHCMHDSTLNLQESTKNDTIEKERTRVGIEHWDWGKLRTVISHISPNQFENKMIILLKLWVFFRIAFTFACGLWVRSPFLVLWLKLFSGFSSRFS